MRNVHPRSSSKGESPRLHRADAEGGQTRCWSTGQDTALGHLAKPASMDQGHYHRAVE